MRTSEISPGVIAKMNPPKWGTEIDREPAQALADMAQGDGVLADRGRRGRADPVTRPRNAPGRQVSGFRRRIREACPAGPRARRGDPGARRSR